MDFLETGQFQNNFKNFEKPSWAKRWCSLVQAKLWLETKQNKTRQDVSIEIRGPLASTKEHQKYFFYGVD